MLIKQEYRRNNLQRFNKNSLSQYTVKRMLFDTRGVNEWLLTIRRERGGWLVGETVQCFETIACFLIFDRTYLCKLYKVQEINCVTFVRQMIIKQRRAFKQIIWVSALWLSHGRKETSFRLIDRIWSTLCVCKYFFEMPHCIYLPMHIVKICMGCVLKERGNNSKGLWIQ